MAGQVWDIFTDNYLKQLKRPELLNEGPDTAYGANMLFGSESVNPWAGRDQSNAKYGQFAQRSPNVTYGSGGPSVSPLAPKSGGTPFAALLAPGQSKVSNWMATSGWDRLKGIFGGEQGVSNPAGYKELLGLANKGFGVPEGVSELGGFSKLAEGFTPGGLLESPGAAFGASTELGGDVLGGTLGAPEALGGAMGSAEGSVPFVGPALGLGMDALTGKLMSKPGSSIGKAGGSMAGAAAGAAIGSVVPGIGTAIGAILGGMLGGAGGGQLGGLIGGESDGQSSPPPMPTGATSPQSMTPEEQRDLFDQLLKKTYNADNYNFDWGSLY